MDLLAGYEDSDDEQQEASPENKSAATVATTKSVLSEPQPRKSLPAPDLTGIKLPPPDFGEEPGTSMQWEPGSSG